MSVLSFRFFQSNPEQKRHKVHNLARLGHRSVHPWEISSWKASNVPVTKVTIGHEERIKAICTLHQLLFCLTEKTLLESGNFDIWHTFFVRKDVFFSCFLLPFHALFSYVTASELSMKYKYIYFFLNQGRMLQTGSIDRCLACR